MELDVNCLGHILSIPRVTAITLDRVGVVRKKESLWKANLLSIIVSFIQNKIIVAVTLPVKVQSNPYENMRRKGITKKPKLIFVSFTLTLSLTNGCG